MKCYIITLSSQIWMNETANWKTAPNEIDVEQVAMYYVAGGCGAAMVKVRSRGTRQRQTRVSQVVQTIPVTRVSTDMVGVQIWYLMLTLASDPPPMHTVDCGLGYDTGGNRNDGNSSWHQVKDKDRKEFHKCCNLQSWPSFKDNNYHGPKLACHQPDLWNLEVSGLGGRRWMRLGTSGWGEVWSTLRCWKWRPAFEGILHKCSSVCISIWEAKPWQDGSQQKSLVSSYCVWCWVWKGELCKTRVTWTKHNISRSSLSSQLAQSLGQAGDQKKERKCQTSNSKMPESALLWSIFSLKLKSEI